MKKENIENLINLFNEMSHILKNENCCEYADECDCIDGCEYNTKEPEKIKTFEECSLGEKYIIYLLETNKIEVDDFIIEHAEEFIMDNPAIDFMMVYSEEFNESINELLNSLHQVNIDKLRVKRNK